MQCTVDFMDVHLVGRGRMFTIGSFSCNLPKTLVAGTFVFWESPLHLACRGMWYRSGYFNIEERKQFSRNQTVYM